MHQKQVIVLASLLKPVDDPRMFEKLGVSMAETNKYAINIIGFSTKNKVTFPGIQFHPLFNFRRKSLRRLLAPIKYWQKLLQLKPELIIVNSHDLLIVSCLYKIIFGARIIYDVQENYEQNILWSSDLPHPLRMLAAKVVRAKENLLARMIDHFIVAEKCYLNECSFINENVLILENKALLKDWKFQSQSKSEGSKPLRLLYSGTIAETYGIFDCINLTEKLIDKGQDCWLTIIGYCPRSDTWEKVLQSAREKPFIRLIGGKEPVPHARILEELYLTDCALISYNLNPSNEGCFPTRVWECLAYKVPMLMKEEHPWIYLLEEYGAGLAINYDNPPSLSHLSTIPFYQKKPIPASFYWEHEEKRLLKVILSLI